MGKGAGDKGHRGTGAEEEGRRRRDREGRQGEEEAVSSTYRQLSPHRDKYKKAMLVCAQARVFVCVRVCVPVCQS